MTGHLRGTRWRIPWLGETLAIINHPVAYAQRGYRRFGLAFETTFMGQRAAVLLGEEAHKLVLMPDDHATPRFTTRQGYDFFTSILGNNILLALDGPCHDIDRRAMQPALAHHHDHDYLDQLNGVVSAQLASWEQAYKDPRERRFYPDALEIVFRMSGAIVLSLDIGDQFHQLSHWWTRMLKGLPTPFRINLPWTTYGQSIAARHHIDALLQQMVDRHRTMPSSDILGRLMASGQERGTRLTDTQLIDHLRFLFFAAYDTTSSTLAWTLTELLRHPAAQRRVQAELHADAGDAPVTLADVQQTPYTDAVIKEVTRLYPIGPLLARGANETFTFAGKTIPAGTLIVLIPPFTHRMAAYFANPDAFEPERFLPPREEHKQHPFAYVGFGLGSHACLGIHLAPFEIKVVLAHLFRRFHMELLPNQNLTQRFIPANRPASGVAIHYRHRSNMS